MHFSYPPMYATCPANLLIIFGLQYKPRSFLIKQLSPFSVIFFSLPLKHTPLHPASNIVLSTLVSNIHNPFSSLTVINLFSHSKHILIRTFLDNRRSTFVVEGQSHLGYVGLSIGEQLPTFRRCLLHQSSSQLKNVLGFD